MLRKLSWVLIVIAMVATTATLLAGPQATLTLRSGDRIRGELVDHGGVGFTMIVRGAEQIIATNEVAAIDFTNGSLPGNEASRIQDGRAMVVMHSGEIFYGGFYDIGGSNPLRVTFRTQDGERDVMSNEIARIYLARWSGMPRDNSGTGRGRNDQSGDNSGTGRGRNNQSDLEQGTGEFAVPGRRCWTDTGLYVQDGQYVSFVASGEVQLGPDRDDVAGPAGSKLGRYARRSPLPRDLAGAFIGRVGNGQAFGIGNQTQPLPMSGSGQLWVGINDDDCSDNRGEYRVDINISNNRRRR